MINFALLENHQENHRTLYAQAAPFPLLVVDGFLNEKALGRLRLEELNRTVTVSTASSDFVFAKRKFENPKFETLSPAFKELKNQLLSARFENWLRFVTDLKVFIDPDFVGGGIHQGGAGSYLEMHTDFSRHPTHQHWIRDLNLLLYLNTGWQREFGGSLDLVNTRTGAKRSIEPLGNRLVVMLTKDFTAHGYKTINFPANRFRTSVAAYAYHTALESESVPYRSTTWLPRSPLKTALAKFTNRLVPLKQRFLGSRTARRARR